MEEKKPSFLQSLILENPVFSLYLGICSILGVSTSLDNAVGMAALVFLVLLFSNIVVSLIRKITPGEIRIPVYIVIIATLVSVAEMFIKAYMPSLYASMGSFISLVVVNCIILGRAEACASKNDVLTSIKDACVMGAGYFVAIFTISVIRQFLSTGGWSFANPLTLKTIFDIKIIPEQFTIGLFGKPVGAFVTFGLLAALFAGYKQNHEAKLAQAAKEAKAAAAAAAKEAK
ncbi:MAG: electron transport complex subunit RsxE [Erysipelotrichaceae bacterium]|nr:electron transport complex subunit RsxE [Erysipelotrichaceae bacterium]